MDIHLKIELICAKIFSRLLRRNLRYLVVVLPMYGRTIFGPVRCHFLRAAYCFARYLDDILDGDEGIMQSPYEFTLELLDKIHHPSRWKDHPISELGKYVFQYIDNYSKDSIRPSEELQELIDIMLFDYSRASSQLLLTGKELNAHLERTFCSALHVTLCLTGASFSMEHVQTIARTQGSLYTLRDLNDDLNQGLVNIPREVVNAARAQGNLCLRYSSFCEQEAFRQWFRDELDRGKHYLNQMRKMLWQNRDFHFRATVYPLYRGLRVLPNRIQKMYTNIKSDPVVLTNRIKTELPHVSSTE